MTQSHVPQKKSSKSLISRFTAFFINNSIHFESESAIYP